MSPIFVVPQPRWRVECGEMALLLTAAAATNSEQALMQERKGEERRSTTSTPYPISDIHFQ